MTYYLNFGVVWQSFDKLLSGLLLGMTMALLAVAVGTALGLVLAFLGASNLRLARRFVSLYVTIIRNTPLLVIVLLAYFALPTLGVRLGKTESFVISLAFYAAAYLAEVFRAALLSVPKGVVEAGRAIGLSRLQIDAFVIAPIMFRNALPALGSNFISLFKDTSIAAAIAIPELTFEARKINVESFRVIETWTVASLLYISTCLVIAAALRRVERRFPRF